MGLNFSSKTRGMDLPEALDNSCIVACVVFQILMLVSAVSRVSFCVFSLVSFLAINPIYPKNRVYARVCTTSLHCFYKVLDFQKNIENQRRRGAHCGSTLLPSLDSIVRSLVYQIIKFPCVLSHLSLNIQVHPQGAYAKAVRVIDVRVKSELKS